MSNDNYYPGKDGGKYKDIFERNAADTRYDQHQKLIQAQKEANDIERQRLELARQEQEERRQEEDAKRKYEMEKQNMIACNKVGLDYQLIKEFNNVDYRNFDWFWKEYLNGNTLGIEDIFETTETIETFEKIRGNIKKLKREQNKIHYLKPFIITSIFVMAIIFISLKKFITDGEILGYVSIMTVLSCFVVCMIEKMFIDKKISKKPKLQDLELEKIKTFLQDYIKAGEIAIDKFKRYITDNFNSEFYTILESVIYKDFLSIDKKKTSRVQRIKAEQEVSEELNRQQGKEYNLAMAKILDEYEQEVERITDKFRKQSDS